MRILWATPYCKESAIGKFSQGVVSELRLLGHDVAVLRTEVGDAASSPAFEDPMVLTMDSGELDHWLQSADIVFANIGDFYDYHGKVFDLMKLRPAVGIFHDWCLLGLFWGYLANRKETDIAGQIIGEIYGADSKHAFESATPLTMLQMSSLRFPMTEWAAQGLHGAVIHSEFYRHHVEATSSGPVRKISLAYPPNKTADRLIGQAMRKSGDISASGQQDSSLISVITIGVVNANKCVDRVIRAIGSDNSLRNLVRYDVVGPIVDEERTRLCAIADSLGYEGLNIRGRVSDEELGEAIAAADIVACLRSPALEGASASAIEGLHTGKPVIVYDKGFYAELPNDCVYRIQDEPDVENLRVALKALASDEKLRRDLGEHGAAWAKKEFSAKAYAQRIDEFVVHCVEARPYIELAAGLGRELGRIGLENQQFAVDRAHAIIEAMFDEEPGVALLAI